MRPTKKNMPETMYRASRYCRVLGNPTAYLIMRCLYNKMKTPTDLSDELKVPIDTISHTLRNLRQLDLVRYEAEGKIKTYRVKNKKILEVLNMLESVIDKERVRKT